MRVYSSSSGRVRLGVGDDLDVRLALELLLEDLRAIRGPGRRIVLDDHLGRLVLHLFVEPVDDLVGENGGLLLLAGVVAGVVAVTRFARVLKDRNVVRLGLCDHRLDQRRVDRDGHDRVDVAIQKAVAAGHHLARVARTVAGHRLPAEVLGGQLHGGLQAVSGLDAAQDADDADRLRRELDLAAGLLGSRTTGRLRLLCPLALTGADAAALGAAAAPLVVVVVPAGACEQREHQHGQQREQGHAPASLDPHVKPPPVADRRLAPDGSPLTTP